MLKNPLQRSLCLALLLLATQTAPLDATEGHITTVSDVPAATAIASGDLNGDGRADIALIEAPPAGLPQKPSSFFLHLFFQKQGAFTAPADKVIALGAASPSGLAIGDFDGDGRNDIAVGLRAERSLVLFPGSHGFEKSHRSRYVNDSGAGGLSFGRINKNGLMDFLSGAAWRQWQGGDRFGEAFFAGPKFNDHWRSSLADMDRDASPDVIFTTYVSGKSGTPSNNRIRICYGPFLKMGILHPTDAAQVVTLNSPFAGQESPILGKILVGDLNSDDQNDLVVPAAGQTLVYLQNSPTGFSENANPSLVFEGATPLLVTDLNGDGLCDMAFFPRNKDGISLWLQQKDHPISVQALSECTHIPMPRITGTVTLGDLDGDGRPEIIAGHVGGGLSLLFLFGQ